MSLSRRQRRLLNRIDDAVSGSDSRLASMLAIFGQLAADEDLPGQEQLRTQRSWARAGLPRGAVSRGGAAIAMLIIRAVRGCERGIGAAEAACTAACIAGGYWPASTPSGHPSRLHPAEPR